MLIYSIVVTYNGIQWIDRCLCSLINSTISTKVLVVDNNSTDGTQEVIRYRFPSVELIEPDQNLGFGKANNIGLTRALTEKADFVFLLNQDAWIDPDTIEKLVEAQNSEYAIISPIHLNGQGDSLDFAFAKYILNSLTPDFISDILLDKLKPLYNIKYVNAAAWLLNMKIVKLVGGFDTSFFMYGEDDNYMQRVKYYGFKIGVCPMSRIYHDRHSNDYEKRGKLYAKKKGIIMHFKDINKSLTLISIRFIFSQIESTLKDLLHFRFRSIIIDIKTIHHLAISFREIVISRKCAKKSCAFIELY